MVVGHDAHGALLVIQVLQQVVGGARREPVVVCQPGQRLAARGRAQLAGELADGLAQLDRPAGALALPEGHLAGFTGRRRHEHAVVRDLLDTPRRCAQQDGLAGTGLEHHFLVEFAHAGAAGIGGAAAA